MKSKKLIVLAVLAVVLGGLAYYTSTSDRKKPAVKTGTPLFEDLPVNDIAEIRISKEADAITLSSRDGAWTCQEKQNHPVKYDAIRKMILKIADIKIGHLVPANAQQRQEIGMIAPPEKGSGTLVEMRNAKGKLIESLLIGTTKESSLGVGTMRYPTGCFVSDDTGKSVYLVKETFTSANPNPRAWLENQLLEINSSQIHSISITNPEGKPINLIKKDDRLQVEDLGRKEETDTTAVNSLTYMLSNLSFDDLAESEISEEEMGLSDPVVLTAETEDGIKYTLKIGSTVKGKAERYARLSAEFLGTPDETIDDAENLTDEEKKSAEAEKAAKEEEQKKLRAKVMDMNNRFSKWTYTLATHKTDSVTLADENIITKKDK